MAVIRRSFQKLDEDTFVPLYKALVRTHLDYAYIVSGHLINKSIRIHWKTYDSNTSNIINLYKTITN